MHYASMMEWQTWKSQTLLPQGVWVQVPFEAPVEFSNFSKRKFSIEIIELITLNQRNKIRQSDGNKELENKYLPSFLIDGVYL